MDTEVRVAKGVGLRFPGRCVGCGRPLAAGAAVVIPCRISRVGTPPPSGATPPPTGRAVPMPFCGACSRSLRGQVGRAAVAGLVCAAAAGVAGVAAARWLPAGWSGPALVLGPVGCVSALVGLVLWRRPFRLPLRVWAVEEAEGLVFRFRDPDWAAEFARLNGQETGQAKA